MTPQHRKSPDDRRPVWWTLAGVAVCVVVLVLLLTGCKDTGSANPTCDQLKAKVDSARRKHNDRPSDEARERTYTQARRSYNNAACPGQV